MQYHEGQTRKETFRIKLGVIITKDSNRLSLKHLRHLSWEFLARSYCSKIEKVNLARDLECKIASDWALKAVLKLNQIDKRIWES